MEESSRKLSSVVSSYYMVEKKTVELKASMTSGQGANLLTDDVKFFFNLVKKGTLTPIKKSKDKLERTGSRRLQSSHDKENQPNHINRSQNNSRENSEKSRHREYIGGPKMRGTIQDSRTRQGNSQKKDETRTTVTLGSTLNISNSAKRIAYSNAGSRNTRSRKSSGEISKVQTNQKNQGLRGRRALESIDLMSTVQLRNLTNSSQETLYFHHTPKLKSVDKRGAIDSGEAPRRWERLYNLAAEKKEKIRLL